MGHRREMQVAGSAAVACLDGCTVAYADLPSQASNHCLLGSNILL